MRPWILLALAVLAPPALAGNDPSGVVLLVNGDSPESTEIGAHYAAKRFLAQKQVVRLKVPLKPELSFEEYRATVEEPLRAHLSREGLEERARCLVLTRGIPVRVRFEKGGYASTAALLEVMDLPFAGTPQGGSIPTTPMDALRPEERNNPYRDGPFPEDRRPGGRALRLVTSLDGWTAADAKALVDRSVAADAGPPADPLFVFQDANGGAAGRNAEYPAGVESLKGKGFRTESHPGGAEKVKDRKDLMGWMSGGAYSGLTDEGAASNRFAPGAIVDMLESFGAVPQNFDEKAGRSQFPVPVMVRAGATGVHGAVAEPYSHTFCDVRLFERYTSGLDLAESFHASLPYLYWMNLVLGDPLCAPFAKRPPVEIEGLPAKSTTADPVRLKLSARPAPGGEAPVSIDLFVDGDLLVTVKGAAGEPTLHPETLSDGDHLLLAVARCEGPTRTRGWAARTLSVDIDTPRIVRWDANLPAASWSGTLPRDARLLLVDGDRAVEGTSRTDAPAHRMVFTPKAPLVPGRTYEVRAEGFGAAANRFTVGASVLRIDGPANAVAGETVILKASGDAPLAGERLEVRLSDPPLLVALLDLPADAKDPVEVPVVLRKSGAASIRVLARRSGASATLPVAVKAGPAVLLFLRIASNTPVGEPFDVAVEARDALGNGVPDWTGTITLSAPKDPNAALPAPVEVKSGGRAVFKGVAFETPGIQQLVATAPGLEGMDDTMAEATTIRRWFVAGPFEEKEMSGDDGARRPADGAVIGDRAWRFRTSGAPAVEAGKGKGILLAVAYVSFPKAMDAVLHLGHGGKVKAWFAGKPVYEGPSDPKSSIDRGQVTVKAPEGPATLVLRVEIRGEGQDDFAARFTTADGKTIPGLRVLAVRPFPATLLSISGTIRDAKGPVAGAEVRLSGGRTLKTRTNAEGWYGFPDLKPGAWRVIPAVKGRKCEPESKAVELKDADATAVDFTAK